MVKPVGKGRMGSTRQGSPYPSSRSNWVSVNYTGWEVFEKEIGEEINELAQQVVKENMEQVLHIAKSTAPKDTGKLEQSGSLVTFNKSNSIGGMIGFSATNPKDDYDYAYIQEVHEGYKHLPGRKAHYLRDAWYSVRRQFPAAMNKAVKKAVSRATSKADAAHRASKATMQSKAKAGKAVTKPMAPEPAWMRATGSPVRLIKSLFNKIKRIIADSTGA